MYGRTYVRVAPLHCFVCKHFCVSSGNFLFDSRVINCISHSTGGFFRTPRTPPCECIRAWGSLKLAPIIMCIRHMTRAYIPRYLEDFAQQYSKCGARSGSPQQERKTFLNEQKVRMLLQKRADTRGVVISNMG